MLFWIAFLLLIPYSISSGMCGLQLYCDCPLNFLISDDVQCAAPLFLLDINIFTIYLVDKESQ